MASGDPGTGGFRIGLPAVAAAQQIPALDVHSFAMAEGAAAIGLEIQEFSEGLQQIAEEQFVSVNRRKVDEAGIGGRGNSLLPEAGALGIRCGNARGGTVGAGPYFAEPQPIQSQGLSQLLVAPVARVV